MSGDSIPSDPRCSAEEYIQRKAHVRQMLEEFYTEGLAEIYIYEPQKLLDGERPASLMWTDGGYKRVTDVIERLRDGAYI